MEFEQRNMRIMGKALREKKLLEPFLRFGICAVGRRLSSISGNLPLTPDMINEISRTNVWWECQECGFESTEYISRNSMRKVWWKCPFGHSWKGKILERAIDGKGCRECEKEYQSVFPQLAVG